MVRRARLLRRLGAFSDCRIVSLIAPAGYGKTSALAQWARADRRSVAWLTADDGDNDPVVLFTYLAAALDRLEPLDRDIFAAIASRAVSDRAVVGRLLSAVSGRTPVLVVIDDAHRITDRASLDALAELIEHLPPRAQVVIASRRPTGLPVARWRTQRSLLEIGPAELAMDEDEAGELMRHLGLSLPADATGRLNRRTEGWPALLALAAMAAGRSGGRDVADLSGADLPIADYLRSEVLGRHTAAEVAFLTRTSILERLNVSVCDAVADLRGSGRLLADLARSTILVDAYGGSYRYHALLREFLQDELRAREPEQVAQLHHRAAAWYEAAGDIDRAIEHAFAAGDLDHAATLVGTAFYRYHWSARRATTRAWFRRFGDRALEERPWLAVTAAWEEVGAGDVAAMEHLADIAERGTFEGRPPDGTASFESGRAMLRAAMGRAGVDAMLANATRAVALEPVGSRWRDFALWTLALAWHVTGDRDGADAALVEAVEAARSAGNNGLAFCILGHRALLAIDRGDWVAAAALLDEGAAGSGSGQVDGYLSSALACAARARVAIHRGDVDAARRELVRAERLRPLLTATEPAIAVLSLLGFARAHLAVSDAAGARSLLNQASGVIRLRPDLGVLPGQVVALWAEIASLPVGLAGASTLTIAELRVLSLLPYYLTFEEIGQRLGVKGSTVKTHALSIYGKLEASSRGEAVALAVEAGLLDRFPA